MSPAPQVFTLDDGGPTRLQVMETGATWLSCQVRAGDGRMREVLLDHADPEADQRAPGYLSAVIGRYANRIKKVLESDALHVRMGLVSPDGDQGFPGEVTASVS